MKNADSEMGLTRRDFIKTTGVTAAGLAAASLVGGANTQASFHRSGRIIGANDRINYAFVGVGGMGSGHLKILKDLEGTENVSVVSVCDVFEKRRRKAQEVAKITDAHVFTDYRRLLENKDIDVVVIATPDHWHAPIAIDAMEAGKHIYVEKPMTHTLDEAFDLYKAAKRTGRSVQVGAHGCSDPKWHKAKEIISANRLGRVLWAQGSYCRNNVKGEWNYDIDPEANEQTIDWKMWLGSAKKRPFSAERYFRWRKYWDYGNGIIGDLWPHRLHPLMLAMGIKEFPKTVACVGGTLCDTDTGNGEPRDVADTTMMMAGFPDGVQIFLAGSTVNERGIEDVIRGHKANLLLGGLKVEIQPERPFAEEIEAKDETPANSGETHASHQKNFIDSLPKKRSAELRHRAWNKSTDDCLARGAVLSHRQDDALRSSQTQGKFVASRRLLYITTSVDGIHRDQFEGSQAALIISPVEMLDRPQMIALSLHAMATRFELVLYGDDPVRLRAAGEQALQEIERLESQLSFYRPDSEIPGLILALPGRRLELTRDYFILLLRCADLSKKTRGVFDVTVGPLMRAWGFAGGSPRVPPPSVLDSVRNAVGMQYVELCEEDFTVRFKRPGVELDLGGYGKGYAIERAIGILEENGITSALLHGGTSSIFAVGTPPLEPGWKIALSAPFGDVEKPAMIELKNTGLSVSAAHGKWFDEDGCIYGHVFDPRTGQPAKGAPAAAGYRAFAFGLRSSFNCAAFAGAELVARDAVHLSRLPGVCEINPAVSVSSALPPNAVRVALNGDCLMSHGTDGRLVLSEARRVGIAVPFVVRVEKSDELPFGGW